VSSVEFGEADARAWTTERMANAPSRDIAVVGEDGTVEYVEEPTAQGGAGQAVRVPRPCTNRPDRMVGEIFGSDSQGDYSCSGSVVTTGNQSVVSTAGHERRALAAQHRPLRHGHGRLGDVLPLRGIAHPLRALLR